MNPGEAPLGVEYLVRNVESGDLIGTEFGRVVPNFVAQSYIGVVAPTGTPAPVIADLQKAIAAGLTSGEAPDKLRGMGSEIATAKQMTPDGFAEFIRTDYENMRQAAKLAGITPQ